MQVVELDKFAPETWCVVGNCFSLQQEPESAIRFFQRALQLDERCTYAHTLCGHEYAGNEDLDKAVGCYRSALRFDARHYNAWYGLGTIYFRQERLDLAEYHFRRASSINPSSSILKCYTSMVLHAQNNSALSSSAAGEEEGQAEGYNIQREYEAYDILYAASLEDPRNPQLHFQLVHVLLSLHSATCLSEAEGVPVCSPALPEYQEEVEAYLTSHPYLQQAVRELHTLEVLAPTEPSVYSLLGQLYQERLNNPQRALAYYNTAIQLDPKEFSSLKVDIHVCVIGLLCCMLMYVCRMCCQLLLNRISLTWR